MDCCIPGPVQHRLHQLRGLMQKHNLNALLLSDNKNIYYYSGFAGDDSLLLVGQRQTWLLSDGRFIAQAAAEAPEAEFICKQTGQSHFALLLQICHEQQIQTLGFEGDNFTYSQWQNLQKQIDEYNAQPENPAITLQEAGALPLQPRLCKDAGEYQALQKCGEIADKSLIDIMPLLAVGVSELELAWALEQAMHEHGGQGLAFPIIVAAGPNSAKPHAVPSDYRLQNGDFVTLDFGAKYMNYCGDCTRTFIIGQPKPEQLAAYQLVKQAQELALEQIKPGMTAGQADKLARDVIVQGGLGEYFSHSLGHGVGLNIHEAPTLRAGSDVVLQPGQIVTVEPGVYLPEAGFGLRIEDSCMVTENGLAPLTHFPKKLQIIQI